MFTQGAALGYVIVGLSARLRPHYQFYRTAIKKIRNTCCAGIADKGLFYCASIINMLLQKDVT